MMGCETGRAWEYRVVAALSEEELNELGRSGWELVSVADGKLYLKRSRRDFRERVTLDQKRRYYALWGLNDAPGDEE
jgi:hypothetical protein